MKKQKQETQTPDILQGLKERLIDWGKQQLHYHIEHSRKEIIRYVERQVERKFKQEIKRYVGVGIAFAIITLGAIFLLYGTIAAIVYLLSLPAVLTPIVFGILLSLTGLVIYLVYR